MDVLVWEIDDVVEMYVVMVVFFEVFYGFYDYVVLEWLWVVVLLGCCVCVLLGCGAWMMFGYCVKLEYCSLGG